MYMPAFQAKKLVKGVSDETEVRDLQGMAVSEREALSRDLPACSGAVSGCSSHGRLHDWNCGSSSYGDWRLRERKANALPHRMLNITGLSFGKSGSVVLQYFPVTGIKPIGALRYK